MMVFTLIVVAMIITGPLCTRVLAFGMVLVWMRNVVRVSPATTTAVTTASAVTVGINGYYGKASCRQ